MVKYKNLMDGDLFKLGYMVEHFSDSLFMKIGLNEKHINVDATAPWHNDPELFTPKNPVVVFNMSSDSLGLIDENWELIPMRIVNNIEVEEL